MIKKAESQVELIDLLKETVDNGATGYDQALIDARILYRDKYYAHHLRARGWEEFRDKK